MTTTLKVLDRASKVGEGHVEMLAENGGTFCESDNLGLSLLFPTPYPRTGTSKLTKEQAHGIR